MTQMSIPEELFHLLVCPEDHQELFYINVVELSGQTAVDLAEVTGNDFLYNPRLSRAYKITEGIAEMLVESSVEVAAESVAVLNQLVTDGKLVSSLRVVQ